MAAGQQRTVKIRFTGDAKGLDSAASAAGRSMKKFADNADNALSGMGTSITSLLSKSGIYGAAAILAAVVTVAPAVGAALTAGILLALGGGALALGIMSALKDPAIMAAFEPLKATAKSIADSFGQPFKEPLIRAAATFNTALIAMKPTFDAIAKATAPLIDMLAPALASMATASLPGIQAAIEASVPLFKVLADKAPAFGKAISEFLVNVAKGGPGAQKFLEDTMNFLIWALPKVGSLVGWLSMQYINFRTTVTTAVGAVKNAWNAYYSFFTGVGQRIGTSIGQVAGKFIGFRGQVIGVWDSITNKIDWAVNRITGLWQRLRDLASSAINFTVGGIDIPGFGGGRASGGPVSAGRSYLVGERGPEILTMGGNGHVTPNHKLGGGPEELTLNLDLGEGIRQVIRVNLREHDRGLKRRTTARTAMA